jgi:hypothetical protein
MKTFSEFINTDDDQINEIALKPSTARAVALMVTARMVEHRKRVKSATDTNEKIDHLSDLVSDAVSMSLLSIAVDQNDPGLLRKIRR